MIMLWSTVNGYDPLSVHSPERQNHERLLAASNIICATLMVLWGHARSLEQVAEDCSLGAERYLNSSKIGAAYFRIGINFFQALGMIAITLHLSSKQIKNHRTISVTRRQSGLHQRSGKDALPSLVSPAAQSIGRMMFMSIMFVVFVAFNMIPDVKFALSGGVVEPSITAFQIGQRISPGALVGICLFLILGTTEKSRTYYLPPLRRMARFLHLLPPRSPSVCSSSLNPATQQYSNNTIPRSIRGRSPSDLDSSRKASLVHASRRPSMAVIQQRERSGADLLTVSDSAHASASLGASTAVPAGVGARRKSANLSLGLDAIPAFAGGEDRPAVLASVVFSTSPLTTPKGDIGDEEKRLGWTAPVVTPGRGRSGSSGGDSETGRERSSSGSKGSSAG
ncbi:hypothetical protein M427DRAFT_75007 [Gonapodya prolifera JEL478]|uniref:Uncharacterized protein n=1 Tax=Gonapodya prolifera (strain JEL478) TaxID=1344416 RepID=A0A139A065_GONPJ|nr:hypothetical protein M427DRAFT_75007 [Gonapodya prolifera JEL478]|eukprot:KXS09753.1 hypothetical protein M427DRAFT_75007 [Gonapodya prolifera JEL478]